MRYRPIGIIIVLALGFCIALVPADAERPAPVPRIGFLGMDSAMQARFLAAFLDGLRAYGYVVWLLAHPDAAARLWRASRRSKAFAARYCGSGSGA